MSLQGKVALVTGGGSGIGRASAFTLAQNGARVAVADRNFTGAEATKAQINEQGSEALALHVEIAEPGSVQGMVHQTLATFEQIDVLVHCAGISPRKLVLEMSDEEWHQAIGINLDGTFYVARAVARAMVERGSGTMILLASDRGLYGHAAMAHYAASKGGVIAFTKSLALELGPRGVSVNAVNPGTTDTPMARGALSEEEWQKRCAFDPLGRLSRPEDIAEIVLFLATSGGKFMTGQLITTRMRFG
jgi:NAD(P)-dependent dehydrogenase (short-subunit alcohol dehydrogenase family)